MSNMISITSASTTDIGASRTNQDRAYVGGTGIPMVSGHETCAVFDGHGTFGEEMAMWCVELLAAADKEGKTLDFSEVQAALRKRLMNHGPDASRAYIFHETQGGIYDTRNQPVRGGTTASVLRIDRMTGAITCASVGDSEVRFYDFGTDAAADGTTLCGDHTATNLEEYVRVLAFAAEKGRPEPRFAYDTQGGRLSREDRCPFVRNEEDTAWVPNPAGGFFHCDVRENYAAYIYAPNGEGLAMTRALGDFNMSRYGVSQEPHVVTVPPPPLQEDAMVRAVVWASDGMWDLLQYADVGAVVRRADFVHRGDDGQIVAGRAAEAAAALLELAKERTRAAFGGSLGDNITVGVTYIVYPRVPITEMTPAAWEHAVTRHRVHHGAALGHSERAGESEEAERDMAGKPPGTGVVYSTRRSTQRVLYRALDGSYWEIVYLNGHVGGIRPWDIAEGSPLREAPPEPEPARQDYAAALDVWSAANVRAMFGTEPVVAGAGAAAPPELDIAFLLSDSLPLDGRRESIFAALSPVALPGSTEDLLSGLPALPSDPVARWMRAGSPAERTAVLESLEEDHPLHCELHRDQILPGRRLRRSRNTGRSYGSFAPACSGCRIGAAEEADDAAADADLKACTQWLNLRINDLAEASIAGHSAAALADRRAEVEGGMIRLEACDAWVSFGDPAVMRAATIALAADDAAADIRRAMTIIAEAKDILRTATARLRATPQGAGYAAYKTALAFLEANP